MRSLFATLFLLLWVPYAYATSIVILITPHYILMGADSKRMIIDQENNTAIESVCKIRNVGTYCYAFAGFVASRATLFSADEIVSFELSRSNDYSKAVQSITKKIKRALKKELLFQKTFHPGSFQKLLLSKEHLLEVAVLSVRNQKPHAQIIGFKMANKKTIDVESYAATCPGDCPKQARQMYFLGEYSGMENYLFQRDAAADPVSLVEQLIVAQSNTTPSSVSAPVHMVKFSTSGVEWIR
ncbi:MAG TPA: hypothetical protein VEZ55_12555 [Chitinophagaceae bacterium]|nr:hypothetical protein [Chitinophagaceae bacterium]